MNPKQKIIHTTNTTNVRFFTVLVVLLLFFGVPSCKTTKHRSQKNGNIQTNKNYNNADALSNKYFYRHYSNKWNVNFTGKEDRALIEEIDKWIGTPYKYAGASLSGTDCSGFVSSVYNNVYNIRLSRSTKDMVNDTRLINKSQLEFGDLVFFKIKKPVVSHVGIYIKDNKFVHASSSRGVVISDLTATYYTKYFYKGGKIKK